MDRVRIYGAEWCEDTQRTREHLEKLGVPYDYIDVDRDEHARIWVKQQNGGKQKTPTLEVADRVLSVPEDAVLDRALREKDLLGRGEPHWQE